MTLNSSLSKLRPWSVCMHIGEPILEMNYTCCRGDLVGYWIRLQPLGELVNHNKNVLVFLAGLEELT